MKCYNLWVDYCYGDNTAFDEKVKYGKDVSKIGRRMDEYGVRLKPVSQKEKDKLIDESTKRGFTELTALILEKIITKDFDIEDGVLLGYYGENMDIVIPDGVKEIGEWAFYSCESLTSITIPDSVTVINKRAFFRCKSLTSITIPEGVTEIGSEAFRRCESLTSITIPESVTVIGALAFSETAWLEEQRKRDPLVIVNGILIDGLSAKGDVAIPEGVTKIGDDAFRGCKNFTSITISEGVKEIGVCAFYGCESLTSITIPESVKEIGEYAFDSCYCLTSITIPESVKEIGGYAFYDCSELTIHAPTGSYAEQYAEKNDIKFKAL